MTESQDNDKTIVATEEGDSSHDVVKEAQGERESASPSAVDLDKTTVMSPGEIPSPGVSDKTVVRPGPGTTTTGHRADTTGTGTSTSSDWSDPSKWQGGPQDTPQAGAVIKDRFELLEMLGEGGMGMVYKALDRRKVEAADRNPYLAVKILNDEFKRHPESLKALQREARKAQDLAHPNIVTVFDFDREGSNVFMTMEYLDGGELKQVIRQNPDGLPLERALYIIEGMCHGLSYAHTKGIVHSDFKPGNVFLTKADTVKIFDFGIARAAKTKDSGAKGEKTLFDAATLGALTPAYASPEMFRGETPDARDDIYALACISYELICGRHPFNKERADHASQKGLQPEKLKVLNRRQWKGMLAGLAFARNQRVPSADQFYEQLRPKKSKLPLIISVTSVGLALAGYFAVPVIKDRHFESKVADAIESHDDQNISESIPYLVKLSAERLLVVKAKFRDELLSYFERLVKKFFDPDHEKYEYPKAKEVLTEANRWYNQEQDVRLKGIVDTVESQKNTLLNELDKKFSQYLEEGKVLPDRDAEDVFDVISIVGLVSPGHPLLTDLRLKGTFVREGRAALDEGDLELADKYIQKGLFIFADNIDLLDLKDKLASIRRAENEKAEIAQIESSLAARLASVSTLHSFEGMANDLRRLRVIREDSPVLKKAQDLIVSTLNKEIAAAADQHDWQLGEGLLAFAETLVDRGTLEMGRSQLRGAKEAFDQLVEDLYRDFSKAVAQGKLEGPGRDTAAFFLAELEKTGSDGIRIKRAHTQVAQAYVNKARKAKAQYLWDEARALIDKARLQRVDNIMQDSLAAEKEEISLSQRLHEQELLAEKESTSKAEREKLRLERERKEKERQDTIRALYGKFDQAVAAMEPSEKSAGPVLGILNQLEILNPTDSLLASGRETIAGRFVQVGKDLRAAGKFEQAIRVLEQGQRVIPGSQEISETLGLVERDYKADIAGKQKEKIAGMQSDLDKIIAEAKLNATWESQLQGKLKEITSLLSNSDPWLVKAKTKIASLYLADAKAKRNAKRFSEADSLLKKADYYDPGNAASQAERLALTEAENDYMAKSAEQAKVAELEGLKQTLKTQAQANDVDQAKKTLAKLKVELGAGDPFVVTNGPEFVGSAYLRLAEKKAAGGDLQGAISLANSGLAVNPGNPDIAAKLKGYEKKLAELEKQQQLELEKRDAELRKQQAEREAQKQAELEKQKQAEDAGKKSSGEIDSKRPCTPDLAGYGVKNKAVCYDMLSAEIRGPSMVVVPAGGGFAEPFAIGRYEISIGDYNDYCALSGSCAKINADDPELPVTGISIENAKAYAGWLTKTTGVSYKLPNENEWVYAARAEDKKPVTDFNCTLKKGSTYLKGQSLLSVKTGEMNAWGLRNHIGNVQEWVEGAPLTVRGGAYTDSMSKCDISLSKEHSGQADELTGFRLVREIK